jgi:hypothetical protein
MDRRTGRRKAIEEKPFLGLIQTRNHEVSDGVEHVGVDTQAAPAVESSTTPAASTGPTAFSGAESNFSGAPASRDWSQYFDRILCRLAPTDYNHREGGA